MALVSQGDDAPHLPPISVIDDYLPNRTWQPPPPPPPATTTPSPPLPRQPYLPQQSSAFSTHLPHTPSSASTNPDIAQIIHHCQHLCESISHHKDRWSKEEEEDSRLWLDDMVDRANEVLNGLLRLRKHRPRIRRHATTTPRPATSPYYYRQTLSSPASTPASSSSSSSSSSAYPPNPASSIHSLRQHQRQRQRQRLGATSYQGRCHSCNISETPEWRRGPDGARTLCNACGLHYAKLTRKNAAAAGASAGAVPTTHQKQRPQHYR